MRKVLMGTMSAVAVLAADGGTVTARGQRFKAELAVTDEQKARGLMHRARQPKDACMVFLYKEDGYHPIWMKNCLISLDVAWVKEDGSVVEIAENVPPCSPLRGGDCPTYGGTLPARHFIEFAAGTFKRIGLKKGDKVAWELRLPDGSSLRTGGTEKKAEAKPKKAR